MKKSLLFLLLTCSTLLLFSQQVAKNYVVVEIGTGTWCTFCPGAAMGADDLVANGHQVAIIENHGGDSYANPSSNARNNYNNVEGFPTAHFNGLNPYVGGSHTQSMYDNYLPRYNDAIAVMSDFTMDLSYTHAGLDYTATISVDEVGDYSGENLVVQLAWTESHIAEEWQGMDELNFVNRGMFPSASGTPYTGGSQTFEISFTAEPSWNIFKSELVAFVQDNTTKEILQAQKISLAQTVGTNNIAALELLETDPCENPISPSFTVRNMGSASITSMVIDYSVNDGSDTGTYNWSGNLEPEESQVIVMDPISFTEQNENNISIEITQVNGTADDDNIDNTIPPTVFSRLATTTTVQISILTDDYGSETSWVFEDENGNNIASGGSYSNNTLYTSYADVEPGQCYTFTIFDSYGDGICCSYGEGYYQITSNGVVLAEGGQFGSEESKNIKTAEQLTTGTAESIFDEISIYPNPAQGQLHIDNAGDMNLRVYDMTGHTVLSKNSLTNSEVINTEPLVPGTYIVQLDNGVTVHTTQLIVK